MNWLQDEKNFKLEGSNFWLKNEFNLYIIMKDDDVFWNESHSLQDAKSYAEVFHKNIPE